MKLFVRTSDEIEPAEGNIGIWWFYNNKVVGMYVPLSEGVAYRGYIQFDKIKNHITEWESTIKEQLPEALDFIPKGYRSIERGRVIYDPRSMVYVIVCSNALAADSNVIKLIADEFEISNLRYDVMPSSHYDIPTYTGNPTLDNFDFGD